MRVYECGCWCESVCVNVRVRVFGVCISVLYVWVHVCVWESAYLFVQNHMAYIRK